MKLVDILARELRAWPKGFGKSVGQCHHGAIHSCGLPYLQSGQKFTRCDNYMTDVVSRGQWQAAVDALKAEKVVEWNGEGLPPVGTVCEAKTTRGWSSGTIIAHGLQPKENLAVWQEDGELIFWGVKEYFRPIRTPEQISADERHRAIYDAMNETRVNWEEIENGPIGLVLEVIVSQLYDAGYRKFEIVGN